MLNASRREDLLHLADCWQRLVLVPGCADMKLTLLLLSVQCINFLHYSLFENFVAAVSHNFSQFLTVVVLGRFQLFLQLAQFLLQLDLDTCTWNWVFFYNVRLIFNLGTLRDWCEVCPRVEHLLRYSKVLVVVSRTWRLSLAHRRPLVLRCVMTTHARQVLPHHRLDFSKFLFVNPPLQTQLALRDQRIDDWNGSVHFIISSN